MASQEERKEPPYILAKEVTPDTRIFSIFKVVGIEELKEEKQGKPKYIVKLGDKTGTLNMFINNENHIKICRENDFVAVLNADAKFRNGFI